MRVGLVPKTSWKVHVEQGFKSGMLPGLVEAGKGASGRGKSSVLRSEKLPEAHAAAAQIYPESQRGSAGGF